jgi:PAS domain-containing protein
MNPHPEQADHLPTQLMSHPDGIVVVDKSGTVCFANPSAQLFFGAGSGTLVGRKWSVPVRPGETVEYESGGHTLEIRAAATTWGNDGGVLMAVRDITIRKRKEIALLESEERYALAVQGSNDGLWDWDLRKNEVYYSERWKSILGYEQHEIGTSPEEWFSRIHPEDVAAVKSTVSAHMEGATPSLESEFCTKTVPTNGCYAAASRFSEKTEACAGSRARKPILPSGNRPSSSLRRP